MRARGILTSAMLLSLLLLGSGCGPTIHGPYSEARMEALSETQHLVANWGPEALFHLDGALVEGVLKRLLREALTESEESYSTALSDGLSTTLEPRYELRRLQWERRTSCPTCYRAKAVFDGRIPWAVGGQAGVLTGGLEVDFDFWLRSSWKDDSSRLELVISEIQRVEGRSSDLRGESLQPGLTAWALARLQIALEPVLLVTVGGPSLPLLDIRVVPSEAGIRMEMASNVGARHPIRTASPVLSGDWIAGISADTLLALARRGTFEQGANSAGLHADLRKLQLYEDRFKLFVRLWSVEGRGWWRDYALRGHILVEQNEILFQPDAVEPMGNSPRADDPEVMGLFIQNGWLDALSTSALQVLPLPARSERTFQVLTLDLQDAVGQDNVLWMAGEARVIP